MILELNKLRWHGLQKHPRKILFSKVDVTERREESNCNIHVTTGIKKGTRMIRPCVLGLADPITRYLIWWNSAKNVAVLMKNLSEFNFVLTNGIRRERE